MDDCDCKCCEVRQSCARILVLSPKDNSDAARLWSRFRDHPPGFVNLKVTPQEQRAARKDIEPTESVMCRACGKAFALFAYLAKFLREQRAPLPNCDACQ